MHRKVRIGTIPELYLREVGIPTLRTYRSGIEPRYERILTLSAKVGILTLRRTIPELSRSSLCAEHIHVRTSTDIFKNRNIIKYMIDRLVRNPDSFIRTAKKQKRGSASAQSGQCHSLICLKAELAIYIVLIWKRILIAPKR